MVVGFSNRCLSPLTLWIRTSFMARYTIQLYVIRFVSDLRQVSGFLRVLLFPPSIDHNHHDIWNEKQYYHTVGNNITTLSETILPHCRKQYYHTVGTIAKANQKIVEASSSSSKYSASFNLKIIALVRVRKQSVLFTSEYVNMYMFQNRKSAGKTGKNNWNCLWC
jgi:hypothetical protein